MKYYLSLSIVFLLLSIPSANACSCGFQIMSVDKILNYDIVVKGKIIRKDTSLTMINSKGDTLNSFLPYFKYTVQVEEWIQGSNPKSELTIFSITQSSACGVNYNVGDRYYLYSYENEGNNYTGLCDNNMPVSKAKKKYKSIIRKFKKAKKLKSWKDINRNKIAFGKVIDKKAVGNWVFYHPDGSKKKEGIYENGKAVGIWYEYLDTQNSLSKHQFLNKKQLDKVEDKSNLKWRAIRFENGKRKDVKLLLETSE